MPHVDPTSSDQLTGLSDLDPRGIMLPASLDADVEAPRAWDYCWTGTLALIGLMCLLVAVWRFAESSAFLSGSVTVKGRVVEAMPRGQWLIADAPYKYLLIEFPVAGKTRQAWIQSVTRRETGDYLMVAYEAENPAKARVRSFWGMYGITLGLGGLGVLLAPFGLVVVMMLKLQPTIEVVDAMPFAMVDESSGSGEPAGRGRASTSTSASAHATGPSPQGTADGPALPDRVVRLHPTPGGSRRVA